MGMLSGWVGAGGRVQRWADRGQAALSKAGMTIYYISAKIWSITQLMVVATVFQLCMQGQTAFLWKTNDGRPFFADYKSNSLSNLTSPTVSAYFPTRANPTIPRAFASIQVLLIRTTTPSPDSSPFGPTRSPHTTFPSTRTGT